MTRLITFCILILLTFQAYSQIPDLILTNGKIFTSDGSKLYVEALAIKGDRIIATGTSSEIGALAGSSTRKIDLHGKLVIPGINDAHDHIGYGAPAGRFIVFNEPMLKGPAFQQMLDSIKLVTSQVPAGTIIQGHLGLELILNKRARRLALDAVSPDHPVILNAPWGHGTLLNTKALELLQIPLTAKDPVGGWYERMEGSDSISGFMQEYAEFEIYRNWANKLPDEVMVKVFQKYATEAVRQGITSVQNMATSLSLSKTVNVVTAGDLPLRVRVIRFPGTSSSGRVMEPWSKEYPSSAKMQVTGMKWILDGTPLERGAFMRKAYSDQPQWAGRLNLPVDTIRRVLEEALHSSEQLMLHIVGDSTPNLVLNAMISMAPPEIWKKRRVRFEHADGLTPEMYRKVKALGIIPVVNPTHFSFAEVNHVRVGERSSQYQPVKSLLEAGIPVAIGSDGPNNPFLNIMLAVMHPTNPAEGITVEQAVIAYTKGSAFAEFMEGEKGMLRKGMLADLVVLSQDIFSVPLQSLPRTESLMTMVGGKIVYDAGGISEN